MSKGDRIAYCLFLFERLRLRSDSLRHMPADTHESLMARTVNASHTLRRMPAQEMPLDTLHNPCITELARQFGIDFVRGMRERSR